MRFEKITEKEIEPLKESKEITMRKYDYMKYLLKGDFEGIDPRERPTFLDFHGIRPDMGKKDLLKWIEKETGLKPENILDENKDSSEYKKTYNLIDYAYQQGKDFLKNTLKYRDIDIPKEPESVSSEKELFQLLEKSKSFTEKDGANSLKYCRTIKATLISFETVKNDALLLEEATNYFRDAMISSPADAYYKESPLVSIDGKNGINFFVASDSKIKGSLESRAKRLEKAMVKYITRPESNAETAMKDGAGLRITIEKYQAEELIPVLYQWLKNKMRVRESIKIENSAFFSVEEEQILIGNLEKIPLNEGVINNYFIKENDKNPTSAEGREEIKMTGELPSPKEGKFISLAQPARQFEIIIEAPENKNEKGERKHPFFDLRKFVLARTRLDGFCTEEAFMAFVQDASKETGKKIPDIVKMMLNSEKNPIVALERNIRGKKDYFYLSPAVYKRWQSFDRFVDSAMFSSIKKAQEKQGKNR